MQHFDVVIVGGGLAGGSLALALSSLPLRIAVLEGGQPPSSCVEPAQAVEDFDRRAVALTEGSRQLLNNLDVWPLIEEVAAQPYERMCVWDAEGVGQISFNAADAGQESLGYIVEQRVILAGIYQKLAESSVSLLCESRLQHLRPTHTGGYKLVLEGGEELATDLVVGADGAMSSVRKLLGMRTREWDYQHHAIVATLEVERSHENTAWQRFMPSGPLAYLPLPAQRDNFVSIVWSADPDAAKELVNANDAEFCERVGAALELRLGNVIAASPRISFPLRQRHAIRYVDQNVALVGDAAHTIHPLAGQGINLGFQDVRVLADEMARACRRGQALGSSAILRRYQRRRMGANLAMMAVMEGFKRLFGSPMPLVRVVRNRGMSQLDKHHIAKRSLIRRAMDL